MIFALILTSCADNTGGNTTTTSETTAETTAVINEVDAPIEMSDGSIAYIPRLWLEYTAGGNVQTANATISRVVWSIKKEGTNEVIDYNSLGYNPLTATAMFNRLASDGEKLPVRLSFTRETQKTVIKRWSSEYINKAEKLDSFETLEPSDEFTAEVNYIYEVTAEWDEGSVSYLFTIIRP